MVLCDRIALRAPQCRVRALAQRVDGLATSPYNASTAARTTAAVPPTA